MILQRLDLARSAVDRAAHRRGEPGRLAALLAAPSTLVLVIAGDRAPVVPDGAGLRLALLRPVDLPGVIDAPGTLLAQLGDQQGQGYLLAAAAGAEPPRLDALQVGGGGHWAGLREAGPLLDDAGAGLLTTGLGLAEWHRGHPRCPGCGTATAVSEAGWARHCPGCAADHYPRTDPAVIVAVIDDRDRILLGRQGRWPQRRYSTLAGFVEPGESAEAAVAREVFEESGVVVDRVTYRGSQPWPFPRSLMLAFTARARSIEIRVDGVELVDAQWWSRDRLMADVATGRVRLPPSVSVARRLVEDWYGGPLA